ncbi:MAG: hypothetical protein WCT04_12715 [Planctomycetota bacterium]
MNETIFPLEPTEIRPRPSSVRCTATLERLMEEVPCKRKTPIGTDTAWALKLKTCVDTTARELHIDVLAAKPVQCFGSSDPRDMLFELDTDHGPLEVTRSRSGQHTFNWKTA